MNSTRVGAKSFLILFSQNASPISRIQEVLSSFVYISFCPVSHPTFRTRYDADGSRPPSLRQHRKFRPANNRIVVATPAHCSGPAGAPQHPSGGEIHERRSIDRDAQLPGRGV